MEWIIRKLFGLGAKKIAYSYDWQGSLARVSFLDLDSLFNSLHLFFEYDSAGRLTHMYSDQDEVGTTKAKVGDWSYLAGGNISRLQLGVAQGVDYVYNGRDWVTQINHQNLNYGQDPGHDGCNGIPEDRFGLVMGYNDIEHIGAGQGAVPQYNGNISWAMYNTAGLSYEGQAGTTPLVGNTYGYDRTNRLKYTDFGYYAGGWTTTDQYDLPSIRYDSVGNILSMRRNAKTTVPLNRFRYDYTAGTNRLSSVTDSVTSTTWSYTYDANGNVTSDQSRSVSNLVYDYRNLPVQATINGQTVKYHYDAAGNRTYKEVGGNKNYYIRGIDGETLAVYNQSGSIMFWNLMAGSKLIGKLVP